MTSDLALRIHVVHIRTPLPAGVTPIYIGRAMPGHEGSVFGNPLSVKGKTWTPAAHHWTQWLATHPDGSVSDLASRAALDRGYPQGQAAELYLHVLREQCRQKAPQLAELLRLAHLVLLGHELALQCWCHPNPCHGQAVKQAILGYATRLP